MPEMSLEARYRRAEKSGNASVRFEPALSGSFSKWGRSFSGAISSIEVDWDAEEVRLSVGDASLMPSGGAVLPPVVMAERMMNPMCRMKWGQKRGLKRRC